MRIGAKLLGIFILAGLLATFAISWTIEFYKYQNRLIAKDEMIRLLNHIERTVKKIYPEKLSNDVLEKFEKELNKISNMDIKKLLPIDAFKFLQPLLNYLNDQNFRIYVPNEPVYSVLPFTVKVIDKNVIVTSTASERIPVGSQIIEINGIKIENLIDELLKYTSGENYEFREQQLGQLIQIVPELLWKKRRFVWIFYTQEKYDIKYLKEGMTYTEKAKTVTLLSYPRMSMKFEVLQEEPPYSFEKNGEIGILKIRSFTLSGVSYTRFREFLNEIFVYNKDMKKLILDIRGSSARDFTIFKEIYEHFVKQPLEVSRKISFVNTAYNLKLFEKYGIEYTQTTDELLNVDYTIKFNPREPYSTAELWLLFDKYTTNAALDFALVFKKIHPGKTIGEEPLAALNQKTDVIFQYFDSIKTYITYPTSKWSEDLENYNSNNAKKLEPDIKIEITTNDRLNLLLKKEDQVLLKVIKKLEESEY